MKRLIALLLFLAVIGLSPPLHAQQVWISGSITAADSTCATAGSCVTANLPVNTPATVAFTIAGTFSATLTFQVSQDCTTFITVNATPPNSTSAVTSTASGGTWKADVSSMCKFRVVGTAYTSGTATVSISISNALSSALLTGGGGVGTGTVTTSGATTAGVPTEFQADKVIKNGVLADFVTLGLSPLASPALTGTPAIAAATGTSLIVTGILDGKAPLQVVTATTFNFGTTYLSGYAVCEDATAAAACTGTLPTAAAGIQYCVSDGYNGSAPNTGVVTIQTSASGQYIIFTDGTLSATGGYVSSGGAARDSACVVGVDSTHWILYVQSGTFAKH